MSSRASCSLPILADIVARLARSRAADAAVSAYAEADLLTILRG